MCMTEKRFKDCLVEFNNIKQELEYNKLKFAHEVSEFMRNKGIPVKVLFFGDCFGLDIDLNVPDWENVPLKIPLNVLTDFCNEFGCDFECTACKGERWIFGFDGLVMGY